MTKDLVTYRLEVNNSDIVIDEGIRGTGTVNSDLAA